MEQTIKWEANEASQFQNLEQERTRVLAQIGALMLDLETAKKGLESVNEKHKAAIQQAITNHGITQFESARPIQGGVIVQIPDNMAPQIQKVNGGV